MNNSGIHPAGHRVVVLPDEIETTTEWGLVLGSKEGQAREEMAQMDGMLVAIGNTAWADQKEPFAKLGERVMFAKYKGVVRVGKDGKKYRVIDDLDVVAVLETNNE